MKRLTAREKLFCRCYTLLRDPVQASQWAGYPPGEAREAEQLLGQEEIEDCIRRCTGALAQGNPALLLLSSVLRLAGGDSNDAVLLLLRHDELSPQQLKQLNLFGVSELRRGKDGALELKLYDRLKALELLERMVAEEENRQGAQELCAALERAAEESNAV